MVKRGKFLEFEFAFWIHLCTVVNNVCSNESKISTGFFGPFIHHQNCIIVCHYDHCYLAICLFELYFFYTHKNSHRNKNLPKRIASLVNNEKLTTKDEWWLMVMCPRVVKTTAKIRIAKHRRRMCPK